jgi:biofilm protein TabA
MGAGMILDSIQQTGRYMNVHPLFRAAFDFLASLDPRTVVPGIHEIRGRELYVIISRSPGEAPVPTRLEVHRRYIDLQVPLAGSFPIGWRPLADCTLVHTPYDSEKDAAFFDDPPASTIALETGCFAVFFPEDAHAPGNSPDALIKAVFKLAV